MPNRVYLFSMQAKSLGDLFTVVFNKLDHPPVGSLQSSSVLGQQQLLFSTT